MFTENNKTQVFRTIPVTSAAPRDGEEKIIFSAEQQERVNQIIKEAHGRLVREEKAATVAAEAKATELAAQLAEAQAKLAAAPAKKKDDAQEDVDTIKGQMAEMKRVADLDKAELTRSQALLKDKDALVATVQAEALNVRKESAIHNACAKLNFVDLEEVTQLAAKHIGWDSDTKKFFVKGENGQPRMNASYLPMSLSEFYSEYAESKPYFVRGGVASGTGSSEATRVGLGGKYKVEDIFGNKANSRLANELALRDNKEYQRLKLIAEERGLTYRSSVRHAR